MKVNQFEQSKRGSKDFVNGYFGFENKKLFITTVFSTIYIFLFLYCKKMGILIFKA